MNTRDLDTLADLCEYDWARTGMLNSAADGLYGIVQTSLTTGSCVDRQDGEGYNALMLASQNGHLDTLRVLIEKGAVVNDQTHEGATALMLAAEENHIDVCRLLLENEADIDARQTNGSTALSGCAFNGHIEVCQLLLAEGASRTLGHVNGELPFFSACSQGYTAVAQLLLRKDREAQVNCRRSDDGSTPLIEAAKGGFPDVVKLLLQHGADIHATRKDGSSALTLAIAGRHAAATAILREGLNLGCLVGDGSIEGDEETRNEEMKRASLSSFLDVSASVASSGRNIY